MGLHELWPEQEPQGPRGSGLESEPEECLTSGQPLGPGLGLIVVGTQERKSVSLDSPLTSGNGSKQPAASSRDGAVVPHLLLVSNTRSFSFFLI